MSDTRSILAEVEAIGKQAGEIALNSFGRVDVSVKADASFVTDADRRVEAFVREQLQSRFPDDNIVGEEYAASNSGSSGYTWVIDPIDGTTNYVRGLPHWAVCIARVDANGRPDIGVVDVPVLAESYAASTGNGATLNGERLEIRAQEGPENEQLLAAWSSFFRSIDLTFAGKVRVLGSTILKFVNLAKGCYIGGFTPDVHIWDLAPGFPILWEAGGEIRTRDGELYEQFQLAPGNGYAVPPLVLAAPGQFDRLIGMVRPRA